MLLESINGDIWQRDISAASFGLCRFEPYPVSFRFF
jgi:hypothetical protein